MSVPLPEGVYQIVYMDDRVEVRRLAVVRNDQVHILWLEDVDTGEIINYSNVRTMRRSDLF